MLSDQVGAHVLGQCLQGPLEAGGRRGPDELMLGIPGDAGMVGWQGSEPYTLLSCVLGTVGLVSFFFFNSFIFVFGCAGSLLLHGLFLLVASQGYSLWCAGFLLL